MTSTQRRALGALLPEDEEWETFEPPPPSRADSPSLVASLQAHLFLRRCRSWRNGSSVMEIISRERRTLEKVSYS